MIEYREGKPVQVGKYLCYVNGEIPEYADQILLFWHEGRWWYPLSDIAYRDVVYGFYGPIPAMELTA